MSQPGVFVSSQAVGKGQLPCKFRDLGAVPCLHFVKAFPILYPRLNPSPGSVSSSLNLEWYPLLHQGSCEKWKRGLARASPRITVPVITGLIIIRMEGVRKPGHLASDASCACHLLWWTWPNHLASLSLFPFLMVSCSEINKLLEGSETWGCQRLIHCYSWWFLSGLAVFLPLSCSLC